MDQLDKEGQEQLIEGINFNYEAKIKQQRTEENQQINNHKESYSHFQGNNNEIQELIENAQRDGINLNSSRSEQDQLTLGYHRQTQSDCTNELQRIQSKFQPNSPSFIQKQEQLVQLEEQKLQMNIAAQSQVDTSMTAQQMAQSLQSHNFGVSQMQFGPNIYVITAPWEVAKLSHAIMDVVKQKSTPILGMDCEGLAKNRHMQLIQIFFTNKCFIIDLQAVNPFCYGFKEVMESNCVMKIFHDFCEDASALICQYNLICDFVFDTQIAHRLITDFLQQYDYRNINIGLNHLLEEYLGQYNTKKDEINDLMQENPQFWEQRPLTPTMVEYAAQDVQYLPQVYEKMRQMDVFNKDIIDNVCESGKIYQCLTKLYHKILSDTRKCIGYGFINRNIADVSTLNVDTYILAFIKNIQKRIVFCSLNLGVSGVIKDDESIKNFRDNKRSIGEIIKVQVTGFEKSGKIVLKYVEQPLNIISQSHPPQVFYEKNFQQHAKTDGTKSCPDQPEGKILSKQNSLNKSAVKSQTASESENQSKKLNESQKTSSYVTQKSSSQKEANGPKDDHQSEDEISDDSSEHNDSTNKTLSKVSSTQQKCIDALSSDHVDPSPLTDTLNQDDEQSDQNQLSSHTSTNAPFNICAQNTSYNFNNNFYQNYVSNSQKQFNFLVKNASVGVGPSQSCLQARNSEVVSLSNICSSQQMSFRDQKMNRIDQSMLYSSFNNNSIGKANFDYENMVKMPEAFQQKKVEKNEERSKSEISLEYQAAFNQANQLSEQAALTGNQKKAHFLTDFLDSKDQNDFLNDLNLTFENREASAQLNSRNQQNGRFQTWSFKQNSSSVNNSFVSPQVQPFYPSFSPIDLSHQIQNQNNLGFWNIQDQPQNQQQLGKMDSTNYGGHHRNFKKGFMKKNFGHFNVNQSESANMGHFSSRPHYSKGFGQKRSGQLNLEDPQRSTPRHMHSQSFPFAMQQPSTPMAKASSGVDQESGWWRNEQFKSQNPRIINTNTSSPTKKQEIKQQVSKHEATSSTDNQQTDQGQTNKGDNKVPDTGQNCDQQENNQQRSKSKLNSDNDKNSFDSDQSQKIRNQDRGLPIKMKSLEDKNKFEINPLKQEYDSEEAQKQNGSSQRQKESTQQKKQFVEVELVKVEVDKKEQPKGQTIITMTHNIKGSDNQPGFNVSSSQVENLEDLKQESNQLNKQNWQTNTSGGPQKLINFDVVQKICQQNQIFNEKKKDEIMEESLQLMNNEGQQQTAKPIIGLDNPYQDLDKVISKAKSQQKVSQMKKTKGIFVNGPASKNMENPMLQFKTDKLQDNDFSANFNRKLAFQQQDQMSGMQPMQHYMQNPHKQMFQAKNKKKKDRNDNNNLMGPGSDKSQRVQSWRNFGNVSAFSQKKQPTFQRAGAQYMKKEKFVSGGFLGAQQDAGIMGNQMPSQMHSQFVDDPNNFMAGGIPEMPQQTQQQPQNQHEPQQQQQQQQPGSNNPSNNSNNSQPNIEIKIQINSLSFRNE